MDNIEREQWIEVCQMFFDAYAKFQIDGTEAHWYGCNYRNIEIAFIDCVTSLRYSCIVRRYSEV